MIGRGALTRRWRLGSILDEEAWVMFLARLETSKVSLKVYEVDEETVLPWLVLQRASRVIRQE